MIIIIIVYLVNLFRYSRNNSLKYNQTIMLNKIIIIKHVSSNTEYYVIITFI